jgi:hypothetical protein
MDVGPIQDDREYAKLQKRWETLNFMVPPIGSPEWIELELLSERLDAYDLGKSAEKFNTRASNDDSFNS